MFLDYILRSIPKLELNSQLNAKIHPYARLPLIEKYFLFWRRLLDEGPKFRSLVNLNASQDRIDE